MFDLEIGIGTEIFCQAYPASLYGVSAYRIRLCTLLGTGRKSKTSPGAPPPTAAAEQHGQLPRNQSGSM